MSLIAKTLLGYTLLVLTVAILMFWLVSESKDRHAKRAFVHSVEVAR